MNAAALHTADFLPMPRRTDPGCDPQDEIPDAEEATGGRHDDEDDLLAAAVQSPAREASRALDDGALADLIARVIDRDQRALEVLYQATSARVHGLVLRITQQSALAEEVVEDTFWQVWRQAPRFDKARGRPMTWLLAMARSRAIDAMRRDHRFAHDELPADDAADSACDTPPPQELLDATRNHERLHAALAQLETRARQLVSLAFFRGLTHEEIAERELMPLGTVKSLIRRAMQQLRRQMEAHDEA